MPAPEQIPPPLSGQENLIHMHMGLSQQAIHGARAVGNWIAEHPKAAAFLACYIAAGATNYALNPSIGPSAFLLPATGNANFVDGEPFLDTILALSQAGVNILGVSEIVSSITTGRTQILEGRAKNPYRKMVLTVDTTNEENEGSQHGEFYLELSRLLKDHPRVKKEIQKRYGPICEIVPEQVPVPTEKPEVRYFRSSNPSNTDYLRDTVNASRTKATIACLMSRSHTVWDDQTRIPQALWDTMEDMNDTIEDTLGAGPIPNILIANESTLTTHGVLDPGSLQSTVEHPNMYAYYEQKGYRVIAAEEEVMKTLVERFKSQRYRNIVLMHDGTEEGERIAANWLKAYNAERENNGELPQIISILKETAASHEVREYDAIFLIGAEDARVAAAAKRVRNQQTANLYRQVPIEALLEGRGSADKLQHILQQGGKLHFVHEILAKKCVEKLLGHPVDWDS